MPKFVIEREIPGAGSLTADQLQAISQKSCAVLSGLGPSIQWVESFVTGDKIYCVYIAPNEEMVREHARQGGFPANRVSEVKRMIDPTTSERAAADMRAWPRAAGEASLAQKVYPRLNVYGILTPAFSVKMLPLE